MKLQVYNMKGEKLDKLTVSSTFIKFEPVNHLVKKLVLAINANKRQATAKVKDKSEVSGGGKKPWKQKGTGNARQGSIRAPQFRGGGIVFGPTTNRNYSIKVNKKEKTTAILSAWAIKLQDHEISVIDKLNLKNPQTKKLTELANKIAKDQKVMFVDEHVEKTITLSVRNNPKLSAFNLTNLSVNKLLLKNHIVITKKALVNLEARYHG